MLPSNSTAGYIPTEFKANILIKYMYVIFVALFTVVKRCKQPRYPSGWMQKPAVLCLYRGILFSQKGVEHWYLLQ